MPDFSKLIFLPIDIPNPPDISNILDNVHNKTEDKYRISPSIVLMTPEGKWNPISKKMPDFVDWAEKYLFPWSKKSQLVVITTPSNKSMAPHIDCSPSRFLNSLQHKFRCVIRGRVDTLRFIKKEEYQYVPDCNTPYIIKGSWPHDMYNNFHLTKYTLCLGSPWEPSINDQKYIDLLKRSYELYKDKYISYENWNLPSNLHNYFNKELYSDQLKMISDNISL